MVVRNGILIVKDFAASPVSSFVVDIPAGYHMASVVGIDVGCSSSRNMRIRPATGGSPITLTVRKFSATDAVSTVQEYASPAGSNFLDSGTSGLNGAALIFNLNIAAPVMVFYRWFMGSPAQHNHNLFKAAVSYDQLYFDSGSGGTYNAGKVYIQLYQRDAVLEVTDFGASSNANWKVENLLPATDGLITLCSYNMESSVSCQMKYQESPDGTNYDAGVSDYRRNYLSENSSGAVTDSFIMFNNYSSTLHGTMCLIMGAPQLTKTLVRSNMNTIRSSDAQSVMSIRDDSQVTQAVRVQASSGVFDGGKGYAVRYAI